MGLLWAPHWSYQGWGSCQICRSGCRGCCQADLLTAPDVTGVWCWAKFDGVFVLRFDHFRHSPFASLLSVLKSRLFALQISCQSFGPSVFEFPFFFVCTLFLSIFIFSDVWGDNPNWFHSGKREMQEWILVPSGVYQSLTRFWWATLACSSSGTCPLCWQ